MKNKTILLEQVKVSDSEKKMGPKGVIRISDEKGNLLIQTENLITKTGRDVIMRSLLAKAGIAYSTEYQLMIFLGKANTVNPTSTDLITTAISDISKVGIGELKENGGLFYLIQKGGTAPEDAGDKTGKLSFVNYDDNNSNGDIKIQVDIDLNEQNLGGSLEKFAIGEIGIVLKDASAASITTNDLVLFSHATFNAIPIASNSSQKISYYIYF